MIWGASLILARWNAIVSQLPALVGGACKYCVLGLLWLVVIPSVLGTLFHLTFVVPLTVPLKVTPIFFIYQVSLVLPRLVFKRRQEGAKVSRGMESLDKVAMRTDRLPIFSFYDLRASLSLSLSRTGPSVLCYSRFCTGATRKGWVRLGEMLRKFGRTLGRPAPLTSSGPFLRSPCPPSATSSATCACPTPSSTRSCPFAEYLVIFGKSFTGTGTLSLP